MAEPNQTNPIDPSENVKALSEAANRRQDDLREFGLRLVAEQMVGLRALMDCKSDCRDKLSAAAQERLMAEMGLRSYFTERLEVAEAKRIDAIRTVDVNAVDVANRRAVDQASVLAAQVVQSGDQLRTLVTQLAERLQTLITTGDQSLSARLTTLEQAGWQGVGKQSYADPAFAELLSEVKGLREARRETVGVGQGINASWLIFVAIAGLLLTTLGIGVTAFAVGHTTPPQQVTYVPAQGAIPVKP